MITVLFFSPVSKDSVPNPDSIPHGRLAERLLSEGLLTPKLLEDLKKELLNHKEQPVANELFFPDKQSRKRTTSVKFNRSLRKSKM